MRIVHRLHRLQRPLDQRGRFVVGGKKDIDAQARRHFRPLVARAARKDVTDEHTANDAIQQRPRQKGDIAVVKIVAGGTHRGGDWNPGNPSGFKMYPPLLITTVGFR